MELVYILIVAAIAYLIGSISTGYLIVKIKTGQDIREVGSGSTGATNVKRVLGKKWFFIVLLLDAIKGALPVVLAKVFLPEMYGIYAVVAAVMVIVGHSKPIFLQFKGGKSVASGVGTILALNPMVGALIAVVWAIITYVSKYVSLGSLIATLVVVILSIIFYDKTASVLPQIILISAMGAIVILKHKDNIKRLIAGTESKIKGRGN